MPNIFEGRTTNEAIEKGLKELNVSKKQVEIKVLESEDKRSFFNIIIVIQFISFYKLSILQRFNYK